MKSDVNKIAESLKNGNKISKIRATLSELHRKRYRVRALVVFPQQALDEPQGIVILHHKTNKTMHSALLWIRNGEWLLSEPVRIYALEKDK